MISILRSFASFISTFIKLLAAYDAQNAMSNPTTIPRPLLSVKNTPKNPRTNIGSNP